MTMSSPHTRRLLATGFLFAAVGMLACEGDPPTSPEGVQIRAAKPPKDGGGEIIVDSAAPPEGEQGAVGLQIHVLGSGFERGAKVAFHLPGETDPDVGMSVQSTSFVSSTEVIATTDIALDAVVDLRDISVSFRGRRGIGTEAFHVKQTGNPNEVKVTATLVNPELTCDPTSFGCSVPGVYSDGGAAYGPDDGAGTRFQLDPQCDSPNGRRETFLVLPTGTNLDQGVVDQVTCRSEDWVFLHLPDLLTITEDCGELLGLGACSVFEKVPAMTLRGGKNWQPSGGFGPTADYFLNLPVGDGEYDYHNFVWQDVSVAVTKDGTGQVVEWYVTASKANLYVGQPANPDDVKYWDLDLALDITIKPQ